MEWLFHPGNLVSYQVFRPVAFIIVFVGAWLLFFYNASRLVRHILLGKYELRWDNIPRRIFVILRDVFAQYQPLRYLSSGIKHFFFFWGFMIVSLETIEYWIQGIVPHFRLPIINTTFRPAFLLLEDTIQFLVIVAIGLAIVQRFVLKVRRLENTLDAIVILFLIFTLMWSSLITKASELILQGETFRYSPFAKVFGLMISGAGLTQEQIYIIKEVGWWIHILTVLGFLNYLPFSKHIHIMTSIPNILFRRIDGTKCNIEPLDVSKLEKGEIEYYGVKKIQDFSWKQILDFFACTECGRCTDLCPASNTEKPLSPMHLVHKLKERVKSDAPKILRGDSNSLPPVADGKIITDGEIWDCTTCAACEEICPVGIEHPRFIMDLRRYLVFDQRIPSSAAKTLQKLMNQGNPWGLPPDERDNFAKTSGFRVLSPGEKAEFIYWVGCAGYFDPLGQKITQSMKKIFDHIGLDIPVLGSIEKCTGDPARRLGEEGLFAMIATENIALLKEIGVKKIITHCPHCYQTLKYDYKQYGGEFEVIHHSEFLAKLIEDKKLKLGRIKDGIISYHDSCYLGRYNSIYNAPRMIIKGVADGSFREAIRFGERSMCCGAGGGKMWYEERGKRVNYTRFEEFMKIGANVVVTACPYCNIMLDDARKFKGVEDSVKVKDLSQVISENLQ